MDKGKLLNFIQKYSLNGMCNTVKWSSKNRGLMTNFITQDQTALGVVAAKGINFPDGQFGIFNTKALIKILGVFQTELEVEIHNECLNFKDETISAKFMLANLDIINDPPVTNTLPEPDFSFEINQIFIDKFLKAKSAIEESTNFAFVTNKEGKIDMVINYAEHNTDRIVLPINVEHNLTGPLLFNAEILKEILTANKDCTSGKLLISESGLLTCQFQAVDIASKYYLVMLQQ